MRTAAKLRCIEVVEVITEYIEGTFPADDVVRLERHLEGCEGCRAYVEQMRETIGALGALPPEHLSEDTQSRLLAAFEGWRDAG